jgi:poly-gamma-glutamate synthase PgsB/CapB
LILEDGREASIYRKASPNIIEQLSIVKYAAERKAKALVMECMALQPQYQWITEKQMIHATIGVITNIRLDHVDIMGHTLPEIANTLAKSIPNNQHFFTSTNGTSDLLKKLADKKKSTMIVTEPDKVTNNEISGFGYIEHKENVSLALAVCEHLGVDREIALNGMYKASPDAGALKLYKLEAFNKVINFYNAFAANDSQSTLIIWNMIEKEIGFKGTKIVLLNTRHDRMDRAKQLTEMLGNNLNDELDYLILIGQSTDVVKDLSISYGVERNKIINLGWSKPALIFEKVLSFTENESTVFSIGNMGGLGSGVVDFFENRSTNYG